MWRPEDLGPLHWSLQLVDGYHNRRATIAYFVGSSDADGKESRFEHPVLYGYSVGILCSERNLTVTLLMLAIAFASSLSSGSR